MSKVPAVQIHADSYIYFSNGFIAPIYKQGKKDRKPIDMAKVLAGDFSGQLIQDHKAATWLK